MVEFLLMLTGNCPSYRLLLVSVMELLIFNCSNTQFRI